MREISVTDLFCGGGGTSTGVALACKRLGYGMQLLAINHWDVAIATHSRNHPNARHICWSVDQIDPRRVLSDGYLDLLCASPECTHHSIARGGMPVLDQKRAGAWEVPRWITALRRVKAFQVENVREFEQWGPLLEKRDRRGRVMKDKQGRALMEPDPARKGETFRAWIQALKSLGYNVEWRVLNCADYGDPTSRKRLFILGRHGNGRIEWPKATHGAGLAPYRTAREIIDWGIRGESIFNRKRPLKPRTLERIAAGLRKFGGAAAEPFLVLMEHHGGIRSVDKPIPTITTARGGAMAVIQPFILPHLGWTGNTVTTACSLGLCEPFLLKYNGNERSGESIRYPLDTVTTKERFGLVETAKLDILFRMLEPGELARAQGFPDEYVFAGSKSAVVKQIGNAVPCHTAAALAEALVA